MLFSRFYTLLSALITVNTIYAFYFFLLHHCTFLFITAHFVHHCTLEQALLEGRYFDSIKSILKQMQCRIWMNKKPGTTSDEFWAPGSHAWKSKHCSFLLTNYVFNLSLWTLIIIVTWLSEFSFCFTLFRLSLKTLWRKDSMLQVILIVLKNLQLC